MAENKPIASRGSSEAEGMGFEPTTAFAAPHFQSADEAEKQGISQVGGAPVAVQLAAADNNCPVMPIDGVVLLVDGVDVWSALPSHVKAAILSLVTPMGGDPELPSAPRKPR